MKKIAIMTSTVGLLASGVLSSAGALALERGRLNGEVDGGGAEMVTTGVEVGSGGVGVAFSVGSGGMMAGLAGVEGNKVRSGEVRSGDVGSGATEVGSGATEVGSGATEVRLAANAYDERVQFLKIVPEEGLYELRLGNYTFDYNWGLSQAVVATYNFESGIPEAEADVLALRLGEEIEEDWVRNKKVFKPTYWASSGFWLEQNVVRGDLTEMNKADTLYYALEFENVDDPSAEEEWIRGKLDYRSCVHSPAYRAGEGMRCRAEVDYRTGEYVFLAPDDYVVPEGILSWKEELKGILQGKLKDIEGQVVTQEGIKEEGMGVADWWIDSMLERLGQEAEKIERLGYGAELGVEIHALRDRLMNLGDRKTDTEVGGGDETGGGDGGDKGSGGVAGGEEGDGVDGVVVGGGDEGGFGDEVGEGGEVVGGDVGGEGAGKDVTEKIEETWVAIVMNRDAQVTGVEQRSGGTVTNRAGMVEESMVGVGTEMAADAESEAKVAENIEVVKAVESEEVEVPKLGGEDSSGAWILLKRWSWLVIMVVIGVAVIVARQVKRKQQQSE